MKDNWSLAGLPAVSGVGRWDAAGWLIVGAPNSQVVAEQSGYN